MRDEIIKSRAVRLSCLTELGLASKGTVYIKLQWGHPCWTYILWRHESMILDPMYVVSGCADGQVTHQDGN